MAQFASKQPESGGTVVSNNLPIVPDSLNLSPFVEMADWDDVSGNDAATDGPDISESYTVV